MSAQYLTQYNRRITPQIEPIPESNQKENNAGGYSYEIDPIQRLERFLILGNEGGTYYASEKQITAENAENIVALVKTAGKVVVDVVVRISDSGRAPKNDPALFVLAAAMKLGNLETRKAAREALPKVARIGTHLFHFAQYLELFGGWGRNTRKAIADWYLNQDTVHLAMQITKYQQRDGWSHADLIRLAHVKSIDATRNHVLRYAGAKYTASPDDLHESELSDPAIQYLEAVTAIKTASEADAIRLIEAFKLPREVVPTEHLNSAAVWEALLPHMGLTAVIRNLGKMSAVGLLGQLTHTSKFIVGRLEDEELLKRSRVHPIQVLSALRTYASGRGVKGSLTWQPVPQVVDALDSAFYRAFQNVKPTGKNILLALDVSGSMGWGEIAGVPGLTPRDASAALALVTAATEKNYAVLAFCHQLVPIDISPKMRLDTVIKKIDGLSFGGTDCSLPMLWASNNRKHVDAFCVYTDNETWAGNIHPSQALQRYRQNLVKDAKLIVVGMTATEFSIADPNDKGCLDVVGFDTATPELISSFIRE